MVYIVTAETLLALPARSDHRNHLCDGVMESVRPNRKASCEAEHPRLFHDIRNKEELGHCSLLEFKMSAKPQPVTLHVPDADIEDLRARLARTRLPDQVPNARWEYGADLRYMRSLIEYWRTTFDWRAQEAKLNAFPQFKVPLAEIDVHYLHMPGRGPDPKPLLLLHGWPGSVFEFLDMIPRLADPARFGGKAEDAFTVIAPSLPGYGLSFKPNQKRFTIPEIADCFAELMTSVLGYQAVRRPGRRLGCFHSSALGVRHPDKVAGIHLNMLSNNPYTSKPSTTETAEEQRYFEEIKRWSKEETGYIQIQGTRPQTLAYA